MTDFFSNAHSIWQYVALAAVVVALVFSFQSEMSPTAERVYRLAGAAVGIQVLLGLILWFLSSGWNLGFMQGWLHPLIGIAAVGVINVFTARARRVGPETGNRVFRTGIIIAVALVVAAIGIGEMA
jgi:hypothetical protein